MQLLGLLLPLLAFIATVASKEISGVFNSFQSLTWKPAASSYPYQGPQYPSWVPVINWSLNGANASPADTFNLIMPCTFKFTTSDPTINLVADGVTYAVCSLNSGEEFTTFSSLSCSVSNALTSNTQAFGSISFPIAFNIGGSSSSVDTTDSQCFKAGSNTVTFYDGDNAFSTTANFVHTNEESSGLLTSQRVIPSLGKQQALVIPPNCPNGYSSGSFGFSASNSQANIDCSSLHSAITQQLNDWNMPTSADPYSFTIQCTAKRAFVTFQNVPAGYRPYLDVYLTAPTSSNYRLDYSATYTCQGSRSTSTSSSKVWAPYVNSGTGGNGAVIVVTTRTDSTQTTTGVSTLPYQSTASTRTIEVVVPIPTTTITGSYLGVTTSYTTISGSVGGTATVIVDTPYHTTTTVTTYWTGSGTTTTTVTAASDSVDTVIVEIPTPNPT
ncbi:hypothetical protein G210_2711, partial [Candida maltosa Xu316]